MVRVLAWLRLVITPRTPAELTRKEDSRISIHGAKIAVYDDKDTLQRTKVTQQMTAVSDDDHERKKWSSKANNHSNFRDTHRLATN